MSHPDGTHVLIGGGVLLGGGIATTAVLGDPVVSTVIWSAGEAVLIAMIPAVVTGIAPYRSTGYADCLDIPPRGIYIQVS